VDIRTVLSQNLKNARKNLRITRIKLAECAGISVPYLADIERRRTWVSDKTLQSLANALNIEPWELLCDTLENKKEKNRGSGGEKENRKQIADLVSNKKEILRKTVENVMEDLILELIQKKSK
jgi:transcriptional regulator with XRE-family HTH domain